MKFLIWFHSNWFDFYIFMVKIRFLMVATNHWLLLTNWINNSIIHWFIHLYQSVTISFTIINWSSTLNWNHDSIILSSIYLYQYIIIITIYLQYCNFQKKLINKKNRKNELNQVARCWYRVGTMAHALPPIPAWHCCAYEARTMPHVCRLRTTKWWWWWWWWWWIMMVVMDWSASCYTIPAGGRISPAPYTQSHSQPISYIIYSLFWYIILLLNTGFISFDEFNQNHIQSLSNRSERIKLNTLINKHYRSIIHNT